MDPREFVADLRRRLGPAAAAALDGAAGLADQLAAAAARWPALPLDGALAAAIAERLAAQPALEGALPRFRIGDLALASWAGRGEPAAIAAFEQAHAAILARLDQRFHRLPSDELRQQLRVKLFVDPARVRDYSGFGHLENWLKVTAARLYLDVARGDARRRIATDVSDGDLLALPSPATDPANAELRRELGDAVKRAFQAAVAALSPRERNFLRHVHVEGRTLEQIARTYRVHRVTVSRALAAARQHLLAGMRDALIAAGVAGERLDSVLAELDSGLDLSLSRVLRARPS
ncbi:MAG TPA: sigma-70 family RNA polymerase sigma factor [Kofleriaceae bacterium]|nr:sigma-70 family RNA polymerase sigma factor [Kofleriaceae bacterium]